MRSQLLTVLAVSILSGMAACVPAFAVDTWKTYTHSNYINDIAIQGDSVWCATTGGVVCWNTADSTYTKYTIQDGLGSNSVNCIAIAPNGDIWCGTDRGASRFHDLAWETYSSSSGWYPEPVRAIAIEPDGTVWWGANVMLSRFKDGVREEVYFTMERVYNLAVSPNGDIWADTRGDDYWSGVWRFRKDREAERSTLPPVNDFVTAPDGRIWCATRDSLLYLDGDQWIKFSDRGFPCLTIAPDSTVWGGYDSGGLARFDGETWTAYTTADGLPSNSIRSLAVGPDGALWCGTVRTYGTGLGLTRFDGESWKTFTVQDGPPTLLLTSMVVGDNGDIWCGTRYAGAGVLRFDGERWRTYTTADGLSDINISSVALAPDGTVWCGIYAGMEKCGVGRFDGEQWKMYTPSDGLIGPYIDQVFMQPDGNVICRSYTYNAPYVYSRFDGSSWSEYRPFEGIQDDHVSPVSFGPGEALWCIFSGGLAHFDGREWSIHAFPDSIENSFMMAALSPDGSVWGATNRGIWRFDGLNWAYFAKPDSLTGNWLQDIAVDKDGEVWCAMGINTIFEGIFGTGAIRFDGHAWKQYTTADGLASNWVDSITIDSSGRVYFRTSGGISVLTPDKEVAVFADREMPQRFALHGNRPNPFNPFTTISFTLPEPGKAELTVYDITGRKVRELVSGRLSAGTHSVVWDGCDEAGKPVSSGVYLSRLRFGSQTATGRMALVK